MSKTARLFKRMDALRGRRRVLDRATDREHPHQPPGRDQTPAGAGRRGHGARREAGAGTALATEPGADRGGEANAGGDREAVGRGVGEAQDLCGVCLIGYRAGPDGAAITPLPHRGRPCCYFCTCSIIPPMQYYVTVFAFLRQIKFRLS